MGHTEFNALVSSDLGEIALHGGKATVVAGFAAQVLQSLRLGGPALIRRH